MAWIFTSQTLWHESEPHCLFLHSLQFSFNRCVCSRSPSLSQSQVSKLSYRKEQLQVLLQSWRVPSALVMQFWVRQHPQSKSMITVGPQGRKSMAFSRNYSVWKYCPDTQAGEKSSLKNVLSSYRWCTWKGKVKMVLLIGAVPVPCETFSATRSNCCRLQAEVWVLQ